MGNVSLIVLLEVSSLNGNRKKAELKNEGKLVM